MTKISFTPIQELVIHEVVEVSNDDLLRERVTPAGTMPLYWCKGILFSFSSLPLNDEVVRDYMKGKIHWMEVHFSKMERYQEVLRIDDEEYKSTMNVRVINTDGSKVHMDFVEWLNINVKTKK
jgi:hypothetical protein